MAPPTSEGSTSMQRSDVITHHDRSSQSPPTRHIASPTPGPSNEAIGRLLENQRPRQSAGPGPIFARPDQSPVPHERLHPADHVHPPPPRELGPAVSADQSEPAYVVDSGSASGVSDTPPFARHGYAALGAANTQPRQTADQALESAARQISGPEHDALATSAQAAALQPATRQPSPPVQAPGLEHDISATHQASPAPAYQTAALQSVTRQFSTTQVPQSDDRATHQPSPASFQVSGHDTSAIPIPPRRAAVPVSAARQPSHGAHQVFEPYAFAEYHQGRPPVAAPSRAETPFQSRPTPAQLSQPNGYIPPAMPSLAPGPVFQSARGKKAHVSVACNNCKAAHLGCDNGGFPCNRCRNTGKTDCKPVVHQQRGRPRMVDKERRRAWPESPATPGRARAAPTPPVYEPARPPTPRRAPSRPVVLMDTDLRVLRVNTQFAQYLNDEHKVQGSIIFEIAAVIPFDDGNACRKALEQKIAQLYPGYQAPNKAIICCRANQIDLDTIDQAAVGRWPLKLEFRREVEPFELTLDASLELTLIGSVLFTYLKLPDLETLDPPTQDDVLQGRYAAKSPRARYSTLHSYDHAHSVEQQTDWYTASQIRSDARAARDEARRAHRTPDPFRSSDPMAWRAPGPSMSPMPRDHRGHADVNAPEYWRHELPPPGGSMSAHDIDYQSTMDRYRATTYTRYEPANYEHRDTYAPARSQQTSSDMPAPPPFMEPPVQTSARTSESYAGRLGMRSSTDWASSRRDTLDPFLSNSARAEDRSARYGRRGALTQWPQFQQPDYNSPRSGRAELPGDAARSLRRQSGADAARAIVVPDEHEDPVAGQRRQRSRGDDETEEDRGRKRHRGDDLA